MGVPATTGVLRTNIADMEIGDYIVWGSNGTSYYMNGSASGTERPIAGATATALPYANTYWYGVKVAKGLIVADRVIEHTVSWDALNTSKRIQGIPLTLADGKTGIMRSLTGGVAYADANGNSSATNLGFGRFPSNNEWDKYIVNFPVDKIQSGKTIDDVFHWSGVSTRCQETPILAWGANTNRIIRGNNAVDALSWTASSTSTADFGFRPVFEYIEA